MKKIKTSKLLKARMHICGNGFFGKFIRKRKVEFCITCGYELKR